MLKALPGDSGAYLYQAVAALEGLMPVERFAVGLASSHHGAGTSSVAWHFAQTLAASGRQSVCLVEANLRTPVLAEALGLAPAPGMRELLAGDVGVDAAIRPLPGGTLSAITAGAAGATDVSTFSRQAVERVIGQIRAQYRVVVVDAAPVLPYPDTVAIAPHLDGMVLVLQAQRDKWETAQRSQQLLDGAGSRIVAAVLNRQPLYIPEWVHRLG